VEFRYFRNLSAQTAGGESDFADLDDKIPYICEAFRMMQDAFYSIGGGGAVFEQLPDRRGCRRGHERFDRKE
jgi:hypothetical protein